MYKIYKNLLKTYTGGSNANGPSWPLPAGCARASAAVISINSASNFPFKLFFK